MVKKIRPGGIGSEVQFGSVTITLRSYLSTHHICAAALFAQEARTIEARGQEGKPEGDRFTWFLRHRAFVIGSVLSSVAFLEGAVNEFFSDVAEEHGENVKDMARETKAAIRGSWEQKKIRRAGLLKKYQIALDRAGVEPLQADATPHHDATLLVRLRNELVHYAPESVPAGRPSDSSTTRAHKLELALAGKFALNPLMANGNPFWPDKCLGFGCAKWAMESALALADEFFKRIDWTPNYEHLRHYISELEQPSGA